MTWHVCKYISHRSHALTCVWTPEIQGGGGAKLKREGMFRVFGQTVTWPDALHPRSSFDPCMVIDVILAIRTISTKKKAGQETTNPI